MQIDSRATIEGVPVTVIRMLFRRAGLEGTLTAGFVRDTIHVSEPEAEALLQASMKAGFLKREKDGRWHLTTSGIRLRGSTAAKPLLRRTPERLLDELLQRIAALNQDSHFLARVETAIVFGSYLSGADRLGDVDVAVHLVPRSPDPKKHREANDRRVAKEEQKGRQFRTFLDQAFWWQQEAMLFLRNRRRGLSLQHYGAIRDAVDASPHAVIFPKPESISTG
jgi:hypothetical protein